MHDAVQPGCYPDQLTAEVLTLEDRIVAMADLYGALSEDRPYRAGNSHEQILNILCKDVPRRLDPVCFEALQEYMKHKESARGSEM